MSLMTCLGNKHVAFNLITNHGRDSTFMLDLYLQQGISGAYALR